MSDRKRQGPEVQVVVRPAMPGVQVRPRTASAAVRPSPTPAAVRPVTPAVATAPSAPAAPSAPSGAKVKPAARPAPRAASPRPPPTEEQVQALARAERVPARIAKGALEGQMPCKVWRKKHAEEARRFDEAYALLARHPELGLQEAFGLAQAGIPFEEWKARREKAGRKQAVKSARAQVANDAVSAWFSDAIRAATPLALVDAERTRVDTLGAEAPVELTFTQAGKVEKLVVVLLGAAAAWEQLRPRLEQDAALAARPAPLHRQPDKRPVSDARPFLPHVGQPVQLLLRNGVRLNQPLAAVGPFDLLVHAGEHRLLVPLHAVVAWAPAGEPAPASPGR